MKFIDQIAAYKRDLPFRKFDKKAKRLALEPVILDKENLKIVLNQTKLCYPYLKSQHDHGPINIARIYGRLQIPYTGWGAFDYIVDCLQKDFLEMWQIPMGEVVDPSFSINELFCHSEISKAIFGEFSLRSGKRRSAYSVVISPRKIL